MKQSNHIRRILQLSIITITIIFVAIVIVAIIPGDIIDYWFNTDSHHFQWAGISAIITALSVIVVVVTFYIKTKNDSENFKKELEDANQRLQKQLDVSFEQSKFDWEIRRQQAQAEIIASSRIHWIEEVRPELSRFIQVGRQLVEMRYDHFLKKRNSDYSFKKLKDLGNDFKYHYYMLLMYIRDGEENETLIDQIDSYVNQVESFEDLSKTEYQKLRNMKQHALHDVDSDYIRPLVECAQKYFKNEWERSKRFD